MVCLAFSAFFVLMVCPVVSVLLVPLLVFLRVGLKAMYRKDAFDIVNG